MRDLAELVKEKKRAFSLHGELGCADIVRQHIELLPEAHPVVEPMRRRAPVKITEIRRQIAQMLSNKIIEESTSPWASAYVLTPKKSDEWRLCIDFRRLNALTRKNVFPLPRVDTALDVLSGKSYYSHFDFAFGYWQVEMDESSCECTAFRTEDGLYQYRRMSFGLTNAPARFQKLVNTLLAGVCGFELQVYLDDVCIAPAKWGDLVMLRKFLGLVIGAKLKLKWSKCLLSANRVLFFGHGIDKHGIRQDPKKLRAIRNLLAPSDIAGVRRITGMMSYYKKCVPNFASLASPPIYLTNKNALFTWESKNNGPLKTLNRRLKITLSCQLSMITPKSS